MDQFFSNFFKKKDRSQSFDHIRISLASPEKMLSWSFGEVKKPETINYKTFVPEVGGLFCARIFGPTKDYECSCGKYKRMKYKGLICEMCGTEVTLSQVRRERMGHIELAAPVSHIWFLKSLPSRIGLLLDMVVSELEAIIYFKKYVVIEPGLTALQQGELLTEEEYLMAQEKYGADSFCVMIGAEAIKEMLISLDLRKEKECVQQELTNSKSELKSQKLAKRLKVINDFIDSRNRPEWMVLSVIPVIPPDLRPLLPLDGGRFAASDLNDLYRRIINRNNRIKRLFELRVPRTIINNEKRMLQESVDALFDNGRNGKTISNSNQRPLKSLSDMLKGKEGRFRQNLLGKRVDYSGRSVITVGPELKLHQCGLPKTMALELFRPFIYSLLEAKGYSKTIKQSKEILDNRQPEIWDILDEVVREHPVLLNRAPTLHRLGIQAFEPILTEGKAIQLHPLVCKAFNADFDGDQMAVHVPLSIESQLEARTIMLSTNNLLNPANGQPSILPSKDIVLGIYYLSIEAENEPGQGMRISDMGELYHALENKIVTLHTRIQGRYKTVDNEGNPISYVCNTTPGRMIIGELLPKHYGIPFYICNRVMTGVEISKMIDTIYRSCGQKETVLFCDRIMQLGFEYSTKSGISLGIDDMVVPSMKTEIIAESLERVEHYEKQYNDYIITKGEKHNKIVDEWSNCTDRVADAMVKSIESIEFDDNGRQKSQNSVFMMTNSGAWGTIAQVKQLAGMRGLIARHDDSIIENPILSNLKEGLNVLEYFSSTHGSRKGLVDTAIKTANSGYLTRRLVDVAQDLIISEIDCGTKNGISIEAIIDGGKVIATLGSRVLGRITAEDVVDPLTGKVNIPVNRMIDEYHIEILEISGTQVVKVRSVLTCETKKGVCAACYGRDLARGTPVNLGEAVGVIAAQSIGEPATQLTMRTFHTGGTVQGIEKSIIESGADGFVKIQNRNVGRDSNGNLIVLAKNATISIQDKVGNDRALHRIPYGTRLFVDEGQNVLSGDKIAEWDPYKRLILAEIEGIVDFEDIIAGSSVQETENEETGVISRVIIDWRTTSRTANMKPAIIIHDERGDILKTKQNKDTRILLSPGTILKVIPGEKVKAGDVLAYVVLDIAKNKDITGGIPRIAELFEARRPKERAIFADKTGTIRFGNMYNSMRQIFIDPKFNFTEKEIKFELDGIKMEINDLQDNLKKLSSEISILRKSETEINSNIEKIEHELAIIQKNASVNVGVDNFVESKLILELQNQIKQLTVERTDLTQKLNNKISLMQEVKQNRNQLLKNKIEIEGMVSIGPSEYLIPKDSQLNVQDGDEIEKGETLVDGTATPHDILELVGVEALSAYLVNEIQEVYRLQGVLLNDKHIEVIIRQMLQVYEVVDPGDSNLIKEEQIHKIDLENYNNWLIKEKKKSIIAKPVLLGITKASLKTRSFIAAASFQETTRVLVEAAVSGKRDMLEGLKENVIVGRLIPAGTGLMQDIMRSTARQRDELIEEEKRRHRQAKAKSDPLNIAFEEIINQMEKGIRPWLQTWKHRHVLGSIFDPLRPISDENFTDYVSFKGENKWILVMKALVNRYINPIWLTGDQINELGGDYTEEISTRIKQSSIENEPEFSDIEELMFGTICSVWNCDQLEHVLPEYLFELEEPKNDEEILDDVSDFISSIKVNVAFLKPDSPHNFGDPFYQYTNDIIWIPPTESIKETSEMYYASCLYELIQWTGHSHRLDRRSAYSTNDGEIDLREELVAEIGAAILCSKFRIKSVGLEERNQLIKEEHKSQYHNDLYEFIMNDKRELISIFEDAQEAVDYLIFRSENDNS